MARALTPPFSRPSTFSPRRAGFSLVELVVVVTLAGIAAAFGIPKLNTIANQAKIQRAAHALQLEVQQAYAIAARNRAPVKLVWNGGAMQLRLTNFSGTLVYRRIGLGQGASYGLQSSEVSMTPPMLVVFPNGLANDSLRISLSRRGYTKTLRVSRSGLMRLQ